MLLVKPMIDSFAVVIELDRELLHSSASGILTAIGMIFSGSLNRLQPNLEMSALVRN